MDKPQLNLPPFDIKTREQAGKMEVFDILRKKYVALTPEEQVRQAFIHYMIRHKDFPAGLLAVEYSLRVNNLKKRADIVSFSKMGHPILLVECKAPQVKITQRVFDQIARYNMNLRVDFLIVTNGLVHYCCKLDFLNNSYIFLEEIPSYQEVVQA